MRLFPLFSNSTDVGVATLLDLGADPATQRTRSSRAPAFRAGSVRLAPGQRVPAEGTSVHAADEVSYIVAGSLTGVCGGEPFATVAGEVSVIAAGEEHWAVAGPDGAEIFWCWYGNVDG